MTPLAFAPLTRWIVAWPDGSHLRTKDPDLGEVLCFYKTKRDAADECRRYLDWPRPRPVKVRVSIEVAK